MMIKKSLLFVLFFALFSCKENNRQIEYSKEGYKEIFNNQNGDTMVSYFKKDGNRLAEGYKKGDIETLTFFYENGKTAKGDFKNGKRRGWHTFDDEKIRNDIFFMNGKIYQGKVRNEDGTIDMKNSIYVDFHLPIDTFPQNEEVPVHLRYFNGKSQYEYIRVYVSNEINSDFSNMNNVVLDTFGAPPKEKDIYFLIKFPNKGKNYIRGYLFDGVQDSINSDEYNGIDVLFEKEVYVK